MKLILRQVLIFSLFILLVAGPYSSFTSLLNYIHKAHGQQHNWHAQAFFVINSIFAILFNILIPNLQFSNLKQLTYFIPVSFLMIYVLTYLGFLSENNIISLICTGIAAVFAGIGSSTIWIVSGRYIFLLCANNKAKQQEGQYYGIFGSIMACNFFLGAILSATLIGYLQQKHNIYIILSFLSIGVILYCKYLIISPQDQSSLLEKSTEDSKQNNKQQVQNLQLIEDKNKQVKWISINFKFDKICLFTNLSVYKKMNTLIPFQILNGLTVGYIFHCSEDLVFAPDKQTKDSFLTITLIFVGIGSAIGAYVAGYVSDRLDSKKVFYIGVLVCLVSFLMGMITLNYKNHVLSLITSLMSGFGMMYTNNMLVVMCSKYYEGSMMIFATNRQMITLSFLVYNLAINIIPAESMHSQMFYELSIFIIISLVCIYLVRYIRQTAYNKNENNEINMNKIQELNQVEMKIDTQSRQKNVNM